MRKEPHQEKLYYFPYHWMMKGYLRVSMELRNKIVMKFMERNPGQTILDLGCGDGYFTGELKGKFSDTFVVGADYYLRALRFARIMTNDAPYVANSAASLGFKKETFDAILLLDVIEHLSQGVRKEALDQVVWALKPGGVVIVTVPSVRLPVIPMHYDHFSPDSLKALMQPYVSEVTITGCCMHIPIIHGITRLPIIWRIVYFTMRECNPRQAVTLIAYGQKN
jgi:2-polyprenyl-3-methyl-5-hydroxy-6-metoxy-1,4-benzoquinol methylase